MAERKPPFQLIPTVEGSNQHRPRYDRAACLLQRRAAGGSRSPGCRQVTGRLAISRTGTGIGNLTTRHSDDYGGVDIFGQAIAADSVVGTPRSTLQPLRQWAPFASCYAPSPPQATPRLATQSRTRALEVWTVGSSPRPLLSRSRATFSPARPIPKARWPAGRVPPLDTPCACAIRGESGSSAFDQPPLFPPLRLPTLPSQWACFSMMANTAPSESAAHGTLYPSTPAGTGPISAARTMRSGCWAPPTASTHRRGPGQFRSPR
jgi:hypothetical protein